MATNGVGLSVDCNCWLYYSDGTLSDEQIKLTPGRKFYSPEYCRLLSAESKWTATNCLQSKARATGCMLQKVKGDLPVKGVAYKMCTTVRPNLTEPYLVDPHLAAIVSKFPVLSTVLLVDTYLVDWTIWSTPVWSTIYKERSRSQTLVEPTVCEAKLQPKLQAM